MGTAAIEGMRNVSEKLIQLAEPVRGFRSATNLTQGEFHIFIGVMTSVPF